jgi:toxin CcdB
VAQWDVYLNPSPRQRPEVPYLVVVQSDLLDVLLTRLVVPLARPLPGRAALPSRMSPQFDVQGEPVLLLPQEAGPIAARLLKDLVGTLRPDFHRIVDALDAVISGL